MECDKTIRLSKQFSDNQSELRRKTATTTRKSTDLNTYMLPHKLGHGWVFLFFDFDQNSLHFTPQTHVFLIGKYLPKDFDTVSTAVFFSLFFVVLVIF